VKLNRFFPALLLLAGCAGWQRDCNSSVASSFGADWIVLQYGFDGTPINCWKLTNTGITNEQGTDGIYWQDPAGHLVHISGWYNRVQVNNNDFAGAAKSIGIELDRCTGGKYSNPTKTGYYNYYNNPQAPWSYAQLPTAWDTVND
jgi:hypothetical protein